MGRYMAPTDVYKLAVYVYVSIATGDCGPTIGVVDLDGRLKI